MALWPAEADDPGEMANSPFFVPAFFSRHKLKLIFQSHLWWGMLNPPRLSYIRQWFVRIFNP